MFRSKHTHIHTTSYQFYLYLEYRNSDLNRLHPNPTIASPRPKRSMTTRIDHGDRHPTHLKTITNYKTNRENIASSRHRPKWTDPWPTPPGDDALAGADIAAEFFTRTPGVRSRTRPRTQTILEGGGGFANLYRRKQRKKRLHGVSRSTICPWRASPALNIGSPSSKAQGCRLPQSLRSYQAYVPTRRAMVSG